MNTGICVGGPMNGQYVSHWDYIHREIISDHPLTSENFKFGGYTIHIYQYDSNASEWVHQEELVIEEMTWADIARKS